MPGLTGAVRDRLRTMLNIRKRRSLPRRGPKPGVGAKIFKDDVRLTVQAGMSHELWRWLQEQGWREIMFRPDRRHYRDVPAEWVTRLIDCAAEERAGVLDAAVAHAVNRAGQRSGAADASLPSTSQPD
ncbi:MAG: hypothetical protein AB1761_02650 [Pseudomonadota bacterium]